MPEVIEWLDENGLRSYPLLTNTNKTADSSYILPDGLILDLNLIYNNPVTIFPTSLISITNSGGSTVFQFTNSISFTLSNTLTGIQYVQGTNNSQIVINTDLLNNIPSGVSNFTNLYIEPSTIHEYTNDWLGVTELTITPDYLSDGDFYFSVQLPLMSQGSQSLVGDIIFIEGYNFGINFDLANNAINFQVGNSYGMPLNCNDQFIDPLTTDCGSIISYINGVGPDNNGNFNIATGANINLILGSTLASFNDGINTDEPANNHSIFIGLTLQSSDLCSPLAVLPPSS